MAGKRGSGVGLLRKAAGWLGRVAEGAIIGGGAILPGISGGVLGVVFGLYRPMMDFFSAPLRGFRKYWRLFLPVAIGWAVGFVLFADVISGLFSLSVTAATWLFLGLIAGTFPSLLREAGKEGRSRGSLLSMALCFALMLALLLLTQRSFTAGVTPSPAWFLFCGVLWGLSLIVPGLTSASILMSMGLFEPMTTGVGSLDPAVLGPMAAGILLVVALLSRVVNRLFLRHYSLAFHGIVGVVVASTVAIIPLRYQSVGEGLLCAAAAALGFLVSWLMEEKLPKQESE